MSDIKKENTKYFAAIMLSIEDLHKTETEVENEIVLFSKFTDFLIKNADEIGKFHAVENEIVDFLQRFSFTGKIDFTPLRDKLLLLPAIRQKLVEMGNEAKKLVGLPDRYKCHKAMEVCRQLALFCVNEMKFGDYNHVTAALETNIPKLLSIQKEFEKEKQILLDIKKAIQQHTVILNKFSAYNAEIQQFVSYFPTNRDTDLKTVESSLSILNGIYVQTTKIETTITQIRSYVNRYNKNAVSQQIENLLSSVYSRMKISDTNRVDAELKKAMANLQNVINVFDKENKDINTLRNQLMKKSPDLWQENNEQFIAELDIIIKKGTEKSNFALQDFHSRIQTATTKRVNDIENTRQQYKWLKRNRYAIDLNRLTTEYIKFSVFQSEIDSIRKGRGLPTKIFEAIFYS